MITLVRDFIYRMVSIFRFDHMIGENQQQNCQLELLYLQILRLVCPEMVLETESCFAVVQGFPAVFKYRCIRLLVRFSMKELHSLA